MGMQTHGKASPYTRVHQVRYMRKLNEQKDGFAKCRSDSHCILSFAQMSAMDRMLLSLYQAVIKSMGPKAKRLRHIPKACVRRACLPSHWLCATKAPRERILNIQTNVAGLADC